MTAYTELLVERKDRVSTITLNRPDRLNAWTATMSLELRQAVIEAGDDPETRCIVLTGAGRGFCAGADFERLQSIESAASSAPADASNAQLSGAGLEESSSPFARNVGPDIGDGYAGRFRYFYDCPKPIIAAINGPCAGIGLILTLYADMRFTTTEAKFTTAFAERGLIAEHGIAWLLPRLVGEANALDLLLTARKFTGDEAEKLGLVNKALPADAFAGHVAAVARRLSNDVSPRSVAVMKRQIRASYHQSFAESLAVAQKEMADSFPTHDFKEGVASFVERRPAAFRPV